MATRNDLDGLIIGFADGGENTATEFRDYETALLNTVYTTPITDDEVSTNILTASGSNFEYDLVFTKVGRMIHVCGPIRVDGGGTFTAQNIAAIAVGEFTPLNTTLVNGFDSALNKMLIHVDQSTGKLRMLAISANTNNDFVFNFSYPALS